MPFLRKRRGVGDAEDSYVDLQFPGQVAPITASGSAFDLTKFINTITGAAGAGIKLYQATQTPALVPGTQAIYNQSTGQFYNPATGQVVNPAGQTLATTPQLGNIAVIGVVAVGGLLLLSMFSGGRH